MSAGGEHVIYAGGRSGIEGVFNQFFYDAGGAFDDLSGGDSFGNSGRQEADLIFWKFGHRKCRLLHGKLGVVQLAIDEWVGKSDPDLVSS